LGSYNRLADMDSFYFDLDDEVAKKEKNKARRLRDSQWWKRKRGAGICYYCKKKFKAIELTMDHLIPISRGGESRRGNIVPACKPCNNKKKYMLPFEWDEYIESTAQDTSD
jgi:5-methylcytosine-specific restriction enzyme A